VKITFGRLKRLIAEASIDDNADVAPGKYYLIKGDWDREVVCRLDDVITSKDGTGMKTAHFKVRADGDTRQRFDVWSDKVIREATPEEAAATEERWAAENDHISRTIDTSREGT